MNRPDYVRCVAIDVGSHHKDYGKTWCGRAGVCFEEFVPLAEAVARPERGGYILPHMVDGNPGFAVRRVVPCEFLFLGVDHAAINARDAGRLLICPECSAAIRTTLAAGTWDAEAAHIPTHAERKVLRTLRAAPREMSTEMVAYGSLLPQVKTHELLTTLTARGSVCRCAVLGDAAPSGDHWEITDEGRAELDAWKTGRK